MERRIIKNAAFFFLAMSSVGTEDDWIDKEATMRLPFDPDKVAYATLKFGKPQIS